jgi:hypothetical protein
MKNYKNILARVALALLALGMTAIAMAGNGSLTGPIGG